MAGKGILPAMRPLIGIPLCLDDRGRWRPGRDYLYSDSTYARAISEGGGLALHLPIQTEPEVLVSHLDGLLLPGGDDLPPRDADRYAAVSFDLAPAPQRKFDGQLLHAARDRGLPILAICYGLQLLVVELGGSLHYDISLDAPEALSHQLPETEGRHPLRLERHSGLEAVLGPDPEPVNSLHHQAVADPGQKLRVSARAEDGIIEAVEAEGENFCLGVQWHPEKMDGPHRERLFRAFVAACGEP